MLKFLTRVSFLLMLCMGAAQAKLPFRMDDYIFWASCQYVQETYYEELKCEGLVSPTVVPTRWMDRGWTSTYRVMGMYIEDEDVIYVYYNKNADIPMSYNTLIHEAVHYMLWHGGIRDDKCAEEGVAREVAGQPWGKEEKAMYNCDQSS